MVAGALPGSILDKLLPPSAEHPFGTDSIGRDLFSYMIYGARTSVILAVVCTIISTIISVVIGVTSAVLGGWFDLIIQRLVDAWQCIPSMLIMLILMSMLGNGMVQMIIVLSVPAGIAGSRMIRSAAISVKDSGYVKMSQMLGGGSVWKMVKHVTPNIMPIILMSLAGSIGGVIMMEASMNFLGYGVNASTPDWGAMLTGSGRSNMYLAPWLAIIPGIAIALIVFAAAMFGDGVRDLLDPRLKGGVGSYKTKKKDRRKKNDEV
jgi:peptide/nickel transport system permease protein